MGKGFSQRVETTVPPMKRQRIMVLGSTGSIGESTFRILNCYRDRFEVKALVAHRNVGRLAEQAGALGAEHVIATFPGAAAELRKLLPADVRCGESLEEAAALAEECDVVLCAIVGTASLGIVLESIRHGCTVALASKEILVMAGEMVKRALSENPASKIVPVDSEHSAIFQCLAGRDRREAANLVLTASGGAFRDCTAEEMRRKKLADALKHPTWKMGRKVTVDSATLMNKALELIEAHWLFGFGADALKVVIHPQSVVHSLVEMIDGSMLAQLSVPDMRFAIQYALSYPERWDGAGELPRFRWSEHPELTFYEPDRKRFPSLDFADAAIRGGGVLPAVLNAANEEAVEAFCRDEIGFADIWHTVDKVLGATAQSPADSLEAVLAADAGARAKAREVLQQLKFRGNTVR